MLTKFVNMVGGSTAAGLGLINLAGTAKDSVQNGLGPAVAPSTELPPEIRSNTLKPFIGNSTVGQPGFENAQQPYVAEDPSDSSSIQNAFNAATESMKDSDLSGAADAFTAIDPNVITANNGFNGETFHSLMQNLSSLGNGQTILYILIALLAFNLFMRFWFKLGTAVAMVLIVSVLFPNAKSLMPTNLAQQFESTLSFMKPLLRDANRPTMQTELPE